MKTKIIGGLIIVGGIALISNMIVHTVHDHKADCEREAVKENFEKLNAERALEGYCTLSLEEYWKMIGFDPKTATYHD